MDNVFDRKDMADLYAQGGFDVNNPRFHDLEDIHFLKSLLNASKKPSDDNGGICISNILDVGCATANLKSIIDAENSSVYYCGTDYSIHMLMKARNSANSPVLVNSRLPELPFKDMTFDLVLSLSTILYADNMDEWIHEIFRVSSKFVLFDVFATTAPARIGSRYKSVYGEFINVVIPPMEYFMSIGNMVDDTKDDSDEPFVVSIIGYDPVACGFVDFPLDKKLYKLTLFLEK